VGRPHSESVPSRCADAGPVDWLSLQTPEPSATNRPAVSSTRVCDRKKSLYGWSIRRMTRRSAMSAPDMPGPALVVLGARKNRTGDRPPDATRGVSRSTLERAGLISAALALANYTETYCARGAAGRMVRARLAIATPQKEVGRAFVRARHSADCMRKPRFRHWKSG